VGRPNVGKSTLLNALLGEPIAITSHHPQTTRDEVHGVLTRDSVQLVFVDTPGLHDARNRLGQRMNAIARDAALNADVVVVVVEADGTNAAAPQRGRNLGRPDARDVRLVAELPPKAPVVLVVNKVDRVKDKTKLFPLLEAWGKERAFGAIVPMCARRGDAVERLLAELSQLLPEQPFLFESDTLSDQPTRFFVAEMVREQVLRHTREEVPHGVAVVVERFDESKPTVQIELAIHVAREAHKKILVGAAGRMLKRIGTDARARVEQMLGRHVNLKLWVRATPGWMNDEARLKDLGY
jgi:GTP-binding protein Era